MVSALVTAAVFAVWVFGAMAVVPDLRTRRYIAFAALLVAAWAGCGWLSGTSAVAARIACAVVLGAGIIAGDRLGLMSLTRAEQAARARVDEALRLGRGADPPDRAAALGIVEDVLPDAPRDWRTGLRTLRWAWRVGAGLPDATGTRPVDYEHAAARYLRDAGNARRIGSTPSVGRDDESLALRAYINEFRAALGDPPSGAPAGRSDAAGVLDELRAARIVDPAARAVHGLVVELLELELKAASAEASDRGPKEYEGLAVRLRAAWRSLDARPSG
jgi:hypothetical protein